MSKQGSGYIFTWNDKDGNERWGIAYHAEQTKEFTDYNKLFIRCINKNGTPRVDDKGKKMIACKHVNEVKHAGFTD